MANMWFAREASKIPTTVVTVAQALPESNIAEGRFASLSVADVNDTIPTTTVVGYTPTNFGTAGPLGSGPVFFTRPGQVFTGPDDPHILRFPKGAVVIQARLEATEELVWEAAAGALVVLYGTITDPPPSPYVIFSTFPGDDTKDGVAVSGGASANAVGTAGFSGLSNAETSYCNVVITQLLSAGELKVTITYQVLPTIN